MPSKFKAYIVSGETEASWQRCCLEVWVMLERMYRNNEYLLKKAGKSKSQQLQEFRDNYGLHVSESREQRLRSGNIFNVSLYTLVFYVMYWGLPAWELLGRDYYGEQEMKIAAGELDRSQAVKEFKQKYKMQDGNRRELIRKAVRERVALGYYSQRSKEKAAVEQAQQDFSAQRQGKVME